MSPRFDTISFLSDYGLDDEFVGVVKSVIRTVSPRTAVIDVTHNIEAHDVRAGGLALARAVQYLAPGVVLAVVDPGVGTDRHPVAVEVADGAAYLVGPDNGLLAPAVAMVGGATGAFVLDNPDYHLPSPGPTFHGRDIFAPVAAHLCNGVPPAELGTPIDPVRLMPGLLPVSQREDDGSISAEVLWVDRYGNAQLNVDPADIEAWPEAVTLSGGRTDRAALRVDTYARIPVGSVGLIIDSYGLLSVAVDRGSAAFELDLGAGQAITLRPAAMGQPSNGRPVAVALGQKPSTERPEEGPDCS
ncbi:MAG: SAM-dependent chlorinase/fluorinase [Actinomycetota bacterium]|nr:SAM-dependent chlorinase/fluorinase [Actinomycetota bacterium]